MDKEKSKKSKNTRNVDVLTTHQISEYINRRCGIYVYRDNISIYKNRMEISPNSQDITIQQIQRLSDCLFTEKININVGYSSTPGYSEYTPGSPGSKGYIECFDVDWDKVEAAWRNGK